jgi:hypothetical protein
MKITLHELKSLVAQIINEGFVDDLKELQRRYPNEAKALSLPPFIEPNGQPTKWFNKWIVPRFLTGQVKENFPFDHAIYSVRDYTLKEQNIKDVFNQQPVFKEDLKAALPANFNLNKINDPLQLTIQEMDRILKVFYEYNEKKSDRLGIDYDAIDIEGDRLKKIGPWNIWMPTTRESSCSIVRVRDPKTGQMRPSPCDWCTTRTKGSNLFYGYTAQIDEDVILYYLIKDDPEINDLNNEDFISIGFRDGEIDTSGQIGGITVSCNNSGLRENDLKRIFGVNYTSIINLLTKKTEEIGGQHPAKAKLAAASQSLKDLEYFIQGIGREERARLAIEVIKYSEESKKSNLKVIQKCWELVSNSNDKQLLSNALYNKDINCPTDIIEKIFEKNLESFKRIPSNQNDPNESEDLNLLESIIKNINCPVNVRLNILKSVQTIGFLKIYDDNLASLLRHENCPEGVFRKFSDNIKENKSTKQQVSIAQNPKCPPYILEKMYNDLINRVKDFFALTWNDYDKALIISIIENKNCPNHILKDAFQKTRSAFLSEITLNPNVDPDLLREIFDVVNNSIYPNNYTNTEIKFQLAKKLNCPEDVLIKLSKDFDNRIRLAAANNPNMPSDISKNIFLILSKDHDWKNVIANSIRCPVEILNKLKNDSIPRVRDSAQKTLEKLGL